jgi:hypothetical protein
VVLSSFSRRSPHEAPPHEGLIRWALVVVSPLGRSWAIEGAQEQVDRDTPVSRTPTKIIDTFETYQQTKRNNGNIFGLFVFWKAEIRTRTTKKRKKAKYGYTKYRQNMICR